jgi:surface protein
MVGMMRLAFCLLAVFARASAFNGDLSAWDVSAVTNMESSAPHAISAHALMWSSHWLLGGGLQSAGLAMYRGRSGVCDSGCGVTLVEAWMVCCACVHARMMMVGMMRRGFLPFGSVR